MEKRLKLVGHLEVVEIERRCQGCWDRVSARQWQVIWLLSQGMPSQEVAQVLGLSLEWV